MKTILALFLGLATLTSAQTSESILFTTHLTGDPYHSGMGTFSLTENRFTYQVTTPFGFSLAAIHGPALPGTEGPLIFELVLTGCSAPGPEGIPPGLCGFFGRPPGTGGFTVSEQQADVLLAGLWYVTASSPGDPSSPIRGQILAVPEPSVLSIVLAAGAGVVGLKHALTRAGQTRTVLTVHKKAEDVQAFENVEITSIL